MKCRINDSSLSELFSLGNLYISDFIKNESDYRGTSKPELKIMLSPETQCLQLSEIPDKHEMYGKYWYRSGTNNSMTQELKRIAEKCQQLSNIDKEVFLDIACNDGTLLKFVGDNYKKVGIDPVEGSFKKEAEKHGLIIQDFFSKDAYPKTYPKASIITIIAMFYDLEDPIKFLKDVYEIMADDGLLVIQQSYMPLMLKQLAFDNICHEHIFYHSLYSMEYILNAAGFKVVDVELNDVNGGSFRTYIQKKKANVNSFATSPYRDVSNMRIASLREYEKTLHLDEEDIYMQFWDDISKLKEDVIAAIKDFKRKGKTIWIYGASTKGNTLLQWFGLNNKMIDGAAERSPYKYGLKTIGTNIPIYSDEIMRNVHPDYLLILPWHFINEFKEREKEYLERGGRFIVPCPKFEIIKK